MNWYVSMKKFALKGIITDFINDSPDFQVQDDSYSCGNAVVQNVFRILKKKIPSEKKLKDIMDTSSSSGTNPQMIENYLKNNKILFYKYTKQNVDKVLENNIILVEYQDYQKLNDVKDILNVTSSHFAILVGYDKKFYYLVDSFLPKGKSIKKILKTKFMNNWKSRSFDGKKIERWGLVIPTSQL